MTMTQMISEVGYAIVATEHWDVSMMMFLV
jgi:hypothetical protein